MKKKFIEMILDEKSLKIYKDEDFSEEVEERPKFTRGISIEEDGDALVIYSRSDVLKPLSVVGYINQSDNLRWCSQCGDPMVQGWNSEGGSWYACSEGCFHDGMSDTEWGEYQEAWEAEDTYDIFWTTWFDA